MLVARQDAVQSVWADSHCTTQRVLSTATAVAECIFNRPLSALWEMECMWAGLEARGGYKIKGGDERSPENEAWGNLREILKF